MGIRTNSVARPRGTKGLGHLADEELMELVAEKNVAAYELIYDRHSQKSYSLAYRIMGNAQQAEEVLQECFLKVWNLPLAYRPERGSFRGWFLTMVHHRSIDLLRSRQTRSKQEHTGSEASDLVDVLPAEESTSRAVIDREQAGEIKVALDELPDSQGTVIELAYFGGFTHVEIAELLDMPLGTVKGRMRLGLRKMRSQMTNQVL